MKRIKQIAMSLAIALSTVLSTSAFANALTFYVPSSKPVTYIPSYKLKNVCYTTQSPYRIYNSNIKHITYDAKQHVYTYYICL